MVWYGLVFIGISPGYSGQRDCPRRTRLCTHSGGYLGYSNTVNDRDFNPQPNSDGYGNRHPFANVTPFGHANANTFTYRDLDTRTHSYAYPFPYAHTNGSLPPGGEQRFCCFCAGGTLAAAATIPQCHRSWANRGQLHQPHF